MLQLVKLFLHLQQYYLIIVMFLLFVIIVLGYFPWNSLFGIECFNKFHTWLTGLKIGNYAVFTNFVSSTISAFGSWASLGNYMMSILVLFVLMVILKFIYCIKIDDAMDGFILGVKRMIPASMIAILAYGVLVCTYNNGFVENLISKVSEGSDINFVVATFISVLGSLLHIDVYYTVAGVFSPILNVVTNEDLFGVFGLLFQSIYGLVSMIGPTSLILIFALSYLDVPYTTWLKYIWRLILSLFIVIFAVLLIVTLL